MAHQLQEAEWIWRDGEFIPWHDAKVHILSAAVAFGSSVFEGIRCYSTPDGPAVFRLRDHLRRLEDSCRIYRIPLQYSIDELTEAALAAIARNGLDSCYIRPCVLRGYGTAGMNALGGPVEAYIPCFPWGAYLGEEGLKNGIDACVSSWQRAEPNTFPAMAKAAGHYNSGQLVKMEAVLNGYAEAIVLGPGGLVSEGSGENVFVVYRGTLITPAVDGTWLFGITRDTVLTLARDLDVPVREQVVPREMLYAADEVFVCGTAAEVTPVRSVDKIHVGDGRPGSITRRIQSRFMDIVHGRGPDKHRWLTHVPQPAAVARA
ncbi:MAG: branched-chain amino acid transaminase [Gemmatimonadetes bacterium]|nr:branched-chain amino acid transaminase [Gemmatimonadota bacterium]